MQESTGAHPVDPHLLADFDSQVWERVPHLKEGTIVNYSPMKDITGLVRECAKAEYGLDLPRSDFTVLGKFEAAVLGGSVKTRPAMQIARDAIASGRLRKGQTVFEATSGNFGIALGQLVKLGIPVVVLVSRRLGEGVLEELERSQVKTVNLDVDVCPAPGIQMDPNVLVAKVVTDNMRERFSELGLDLKIFDASRPETEQLLARQDVINLAKHLAKAYDGFCPEQYDNELNVLAHQTVTGPEIDQQLRERGSSLAEFNVVCAFGTGGTSTGLSRYMSGKYGRNSVHLVFPREGQDVAGIRTRSKASGLSFYHPAMYAGQHDVDFEQAKKVLLYLTKKGLDIGESSALALYAVIQMVNFGIQGRFLAILADGIEKYEAVLESEESEDVSNLPEVNLEQARAHLGEYGEILWTHAGYAPNAEGSKLILKALDAGAGPTKMDTASAADVAQAVVTGQIPPRLKEMVDKKDGRVLLVCMSGNTSLRIAQLLSENGIKAQSLTGGIGMIAQAAGKPVGALVRAAA